MKSHSLALAACFAAAAASSCGLHFRPNWGAPRDTDATAVFLKEAAASDMAVCLDGSPGAYYFRAATGQSSKWYIHHQGGGWCESADDCYERSKTTLGSSTTYPPSASLGDGYFSQDPAVNPMMYDWNAVFIRYCDGASFSGNNASTLSVNGVDLHFRGHHILNAVMEDLLANHGLEDATDVVVSGCSAGGLATYLHVDEWRSRLPEAAKVVGLPDSGFFLDVEMPVTDPEDVGTTIPGNYHDGMLWVFEQANSTAGVNQDCIAAHEPTKDTWKCIFAEHTAPHIKTPTFALQSQYDRWQSEHVLDNITVPLVTALGKNITSRLETNLLSNPIHGAFLDSCYHHCGEWGEIKPIDGDEQSTAFMKYYYNITGQHFWNQAQAYPCDSCCL